MKITILVCGRIFYKYLIREFDILLLDFLEEREQNSPKEEKKVSANAVCENVENEKQDLYIRRDGSA